MPCLPSRAEDFRLHVDAGQYRDVFDLPSRHMVKYGLAPLRAVPSRVIFYIR